MIRTSCGRSALAGAPTPPTSCGGAEARLAVVESQSTHLIQSRLASTDRFFAVHVRAGLKHHFLLVILAKTAMKPSEYRVHGRDQCCRGKRQNERIGKIVF